MAPDLAKPAPWTLSTGQSMLLLVAAGSELRCLEGRLALSGAPRLLGDALASHRWLLQPGQAWRADSAQWLTLHGPARVLHTPCETPVQAKKNRLGAAAARRWIERAIRAVLRRVPRAVSTRSL